MGLTAQRLSQLGLVDEVIEEPLGGAHRNHPLIAERLKSAIIRHLSSLEKLAPDDLRAQRQAKIASFGVFSENKE
jgi:acetyl-CoA carboxylase carboxyl transferase subunit alpha